jgi:hypothetical protein
VLIIASSALISLSFFTPYWLQSFASPKLLQPKFSNLGQIAMAVVGVVS